MNKDHRKAEIKIVNDKEYKKCKGCEEWKPNTTEYFYMKNKSKPELGTQSRCKKCCSKESRNRALKNPELTKKRVKSWTKTHKEQISKVAREWKETHKSQFKNYVKEYCQTNPDKISYYNNNRRHKNHKISKEEWDSCKQYFNNSCAYCGMTEEDHKKTVNQQLHKEHVVFDGSIYLDNCVPACRMCNSKKWEYDMEEWYRLQDYFSEERLNKIKQWTTEDYKKYIECDINNNQEKCG